MKYRATLLQGRSLADRRARALKKTITDASLKLTLGVILVGDDPASHLYVSLKEKRGYELGVGIKKMLLSKSATEKDIMAEIERFNIDNEVHGILVQLPLPKGIDATHIIKMIAPEKDVDGFLTNSLVPSPLLSAIGDLLRATNLSLKGRKAKLFVNSDIFHKDLRERLEKEGIAIVDDPLEADIIITAKGIAHFLKASMVKEGAVVIDVGASKLDDERIVGDVDESVFKKAMFVSPVPGGVGPLTVIHLFENLVFLAQHLKTSA